MSTTTRVNKISTSENAQESHESLVKCVHQGRERSRVWPFVLLAMSGGKKVARRLEVTNISLGAC